MDTKMIDILEILDTMWTPKRNLIIKSSKNPWKKNARPTVNGKDLVGYLQTASFASSPETAIKIGRRLVQVGGLIPTFRIERASDCFCPSPRKTYEMRGISYRENAVLNDLVSIPFNPRSLREVLEDLNTVFWTLCHLAVSNDGKFIYYSRIRGSETWKNCLHILHDLAVADSTGFGEQPDSIKKASFVNLHNLLVIHSKLVFGHPAKKAQVLRAVTRVAYRISGERMTTRDLMHCAVGYKDPKNRVLAGHTWSVKKQDERVLFALSLGTKSSPSMLALSEEKCDSHLGALTRSFLDDQLLIDSKARIVQLPSCFKSYPTLFPPDDKSSLFKMLATYCNSDMDVLEEAKRLRFDLRFVRYDFECNGDAEVVLSYSKLPRP